MTTTRFSHVGLTCKDPIAIEKFYTRYFGFKRTRVYAPGPDQVVIITSGNLSFELFKASETSHLPLPEKSGYEFPGWRHICFAVDDLDAKLKELGEDARPTLGPADMGQFIPGMKVCWLADPEGNIFELNQGYVDEANPPQLES
ncbi:MAG: glyoxalase [Gallionellales bacterium RIFCSPLOWO2_12_FULL_59_22]|nr:MAG: glyoxalase [Gallionellales bacterium RIFCSPLOWO2_02_58_13]OGT13214.1 MAG: glyoxalase [Gallionellales bacterium RIFCSPLOWO2_12_FULL_59_22]